MRKRFFLLIVLVLFSAYLITAREETSPVLAASFTAITPVSATSNVNSADAPNTIDGNTNTIWQAAADPEACITFDLGQVEQVVGIRETSGAFPANPFTVFVSTDGVNFNQVASGTLTQFSFGEHFFSSVNAQFIKLCIQRTDDTGFGELAEFQVLVPDVSTVDDEGPLTSNVVADPNPAPIDTEVLLTATVDDTTTGGSNIATAEYSLDGGSTWTPMAASDSAFDSVEEDAQATIGPFTTPQVLDVCVRGTDVAGNTGDPECILLAVYDPDGGFVTGGGWIWSPAGAYAADPDLEGRATFGFVSKYNKGKTVPDGNTEFQFKAGDLNFKSTSYEWLVVNQNDSNAQFKGFGTVNGGNAPNGSPFRFMLWAGDGDPDTFCIKIWWEDNGDEIVVYDNGSNQPIGGGNIVVHSGKKK